MIAFPRGAGARIFHGALRGVELRVTVVGHGAEPRPRADRLAVRQADDRIVGLHTVGGRRRNTRAALDRGDLVQRRHDVAHLIEGAGHRVCTIETIDERVAEQLIGARRGCRHRHAPPHVGQQGRAVESRSRRCLRRCVGRARGAGRQQAKAGQRAGGADAAQPREIRERH